MRIRMSFLAVTVLSSSVGFGIPHAFAQGTKGADHTDLLARIEQVSGEVQSAQADGRVTRTQASKLNQQLRFMRRNVETVTKHQGFLSAAESSTYNRNLDEVEEKL